MKLSNRILLFALPVLGSLLMGVALVWEHYFIYISITAVIGADCALYFMIRDRARDSKMVFLATFPFLTFILFSFGILFVLEQFEVKILVIVAHALLGMVYLLTMLPILNTPNTSQDRSFANMSGTLHTMSILYAATLSFGLQYYIDTPGWYLVIPFSALWAGAFLHMLFCHHIDQRIQVRALTTCALLLALELLFAVQWLPSFYIVNALIIALFFYISSNLIISAVRNELSRTQLATYVVVGALVIVLVLGTSLF